MIFCKYSCLYCNNPLQHRDCFSHLPIRPVQKPDLAHTPWPRALHTEPRFFGFSSAMNNMKLPTPRGTFFAHLEHIDFDWLPSNHIDPKVVYRLEQGLKAECRRDDPRNHMAVETSKTEFLQSQRSQADNSSLQKISLGLGARLKGLHGKHRHAAAKAILLGDDRWWPVDVYTVEEKLCVVIRNCAFTLNHIGRNCC